MDSADVTVHIEAITDTSRPHSQIPFPIKFVKASCTSVRITLEKCNSCGKTPLPIHLSPDESTMEPSDLSNKHNKDLTWGRVHFRGMTAGGYGQCRDHRGPELAADGHGNMYGDRSSYLPDRRDTTEYHFVSLE